jgi:hypothetical protein
VAAGAAVVQDGVVVAAVEVWVQAAAAEVRALTDAGALAEARVVVAVEAWAGAAVEAVVVAAEAGVKAIAGLGSLALSNGVWADPQRRLSVQ